MRYFLDTEFIEKPGILQLISIAVVSEDGREFYEESNAFNSEDASQWVKENVLPHLKSDLPERKNPKTIGQDLLSWIGNDTRPEFWGYYCDYDWVVFCWMFGAMIDLPKQFPMYCRDLKQVLDDRGDPSIPFKPGIEHDAVCDARWNKEVYDWIFQGDTE